MTIQINTDKNLAVHETYHQQLEGLLTDKLGRFSDHITRLEVHLSDENGAKESLEDKKCLIEARLKGRQPIAVSSLGNTYDHCVSGAILKLKAALDTIMGKLGTH